MSNWQTCEYHNDRETTLFYDDLGSLGSVETPYTACAWRRVHDADGKLIAHVRRRWDAAFVANILIEARA